MKILLVGSMTGITNKDYGIDLMIEINVVTVMGVLGARIFGGFIGFHGFFLFQYVGRVPKCWEKYGFAVGDFVGSEKFCNPCLYCISALLANHGSDSGTSVGYIPAQFKTNEQAGD